MSRRCYISIRAIEKVVCAVRDGELARTPGCSGVLDVVPRGRPSDSDAHQWQLSKPPAGGERALEARHQRFVGADVVELVPAANRLR